MMKLARREDVLGNPSIPRVHNMHKGAFVDGGQAVNPAEVVSMIADLDKALHESAKGISLDQVSPDALTKMSDMGLPVLQLQRQQAGLQAQNTRFQEMVQKMGISADMAKEITLSGIGNWTQTDGPWIYDLETPALQTFPVRTPIVNKLPRGKGAGTSKRFRRIDGISGSKTGGVATMDISFAESVSTSFRGLSLNRPSKISYATSLGNLTYKLWGISDDLTWTSQFAGVGFDDLRAMIARNLIFGHKLGEEHQTYGGRITALATPAAPTCTQRAPVAGEAAISGSGGNVYVKTTALGHFGESIQSAATTVALTGGNVIDVTVANAFSAGAHGFRVYVSTAAGADPGDASRFRCVWQAGVVVGQDYSGGNLFTISGALPTTGDTSSTHTVDTSGNANNFDGVMAQTAANGGVSTRLNGVLTLDAINKQLFYPLFNVNQADPDEVWVHALESIRITDLVLGASGTPYRVAVNMDQQQEVMGTYRVSRLVNKVTGKVVDVTVHPFAEQGNLLALSYAPPFPAEGVDGVWKFYLPQDILEIDWPVIQMSYDVSTYAYGVLVCHAPVFNGILQGIQPA